jgi:hypothetical protein
MGGMIVLREEIVKAKVCLVMKIMLSVKMRIILYTSQCRVLSRRVRVVPEGGSTYDDGSS